MEVTDGQQHNTMTTVSHETQWTYAPWWSEMRVHPGVGGSCQRYITSASLGGHIKHPKLKATYNTTGLQSSKALRSWTPKEDEGIVPDWKRRKRLENTAQRVTLPWALCSKDIDGKAGGTGWKQRSNVNVPIWTVSLRLRRGMELEETYVKAFEWWDIHQVGNLPSHGLGRKTSLYRIYNRWVGLGSFQIKRKKCIQNYTLCSNVLGNIHNFQLITTFLNSVLYECPQLTVNSTSGQMLVKWISWKWQTRILNMDGH